MKSPLRSPLNIGHHCKKCIGMGALWGNLKLLFCSNRKFGAPGAKISALPPAGLDMITPQRLKWKFASGKGMETVEMSRSSEALAMSSREEEEEDEEEEEEKGGEDEAGEETIKVDGDDDDETKTDDSTEMECR